MSTIISLGTILFGLIWSQQVPKPLTRRITVLLAITALLQFDTLIGLSSYSIYFITFASIMAGVEPSNSFYLRPYEKNFFLFSSLLFVALSIDSLLDISFQINRVYFGLVYLFAAVILLINDYNRVKSRLGIIIIWSGFAINWLLTVII